VSGPLLEVCGLSKAFGASRALKSVDFDVREGEIHALLGENGAGKSTLIKILAGIYRADTGTVRFRGVPVDPAMRAIPASFVHQELGLVDDMTVAENIALVSGYPIRRGLISWRDVGSSAKRVMQIMGVDLDVGRTVSNLSMAERSLVAIARGWLSTHGYSYLMNRQPRYLQTTWPDSSRCFGDCALAALVSSM
jgi:ribose transport system ATP-binding protein